MAEERKNSDHSMPTDGTAAAANHDDAAGRPAGAGGGTRRFETLLQPLPDDDGPLSAEEDEWAAAEAQRRLIRRHVQRGADDGDGDDSHSEGGSDDDDDDEPWFNEPQPIANPMAMRADRAGDSDSNADSDEGDSDSDEDDDDVRGDDDDMDDAAAERIRAGVAFAAAGAREDIAEMDPLADMGLPAEDAPAEEFERFLEVLRRADELALPEFEGDDDGQGQDDRGDGPVDGRGPLAAPAADRAVERAQAAVRQLRLALERAERRRARIARQIEEQQARAAILIPVPVPPADYRPVGIATAAEPSHWFAGRHTELISARPRPTAESAGVVTAEQTAYGRDPQGIEWATLRQRRDEFRADRLARYPQAHPHCPLPSPTLQAERTPVAVPASPHYSFHRNLLPLRPSYYHPQLRHLLHAPSAVDVVAVCADYAVQSINLAAGPLPAVGTVDEEAAEAALAQADEQRRPHAHAPTSSTLFDFSQLDAAVTSLLAVPRSSLLLLGSMDGGLSLRNRRSGALLHQLRLSDSSNAICNAITLAVPSLPPLRDELAADGSLLPCPGAATARFFVSDNDCFSRSFDLATMTALRDYPEEWPVNYAAASPDGRTLAVGGDSHAALLRDADSGKLLCTLRGHRDDIFSLAFHPTRPLLATGAQDHSARIFDLRRPDRPLIVLAAQMAPVRSVQFSHDGDYLAVAEGADFVHVVDMCASTSDSVSVQSIDLFGEVTGVAFSPDDAALFVGVADAVYGGVVEYRRAAKRSPIIDLFFD